MFVTFDLKVLRRMYLAMELSSSKGLDFKRVHNIEFSLNMS